MEHGRQSYRLLIAIAAGPRTDSEDVPVRIVDDFDEFVQTVSLQELVGELLFLRGDECRSTAVYRWDTYSY